MKKQKFNVPTLMFTKKPKKMVSWRLNADLLSALGKIASEKGWDTTQLVSIIIDQYLQGELAD